MSESRLGSPGKGWHIYSIGVVGLDKHPTFKPNEIEVMPIEIITEHNGPIVKLKKKKKSKKGHNKNKGKSKDGNGNLSILGTPPMVTVRARFKNDGTNRHTAPDVRKGQTVEIWRYGDTDTFHWKPTFKEDDLIRKENVIHTYGNEDNFKKTQSNENVWYSQVDTIGKRWGIHIADNDGEATSWDIGVDAKKGEFKIGNGRKHGIALGKKGFDVGGNMVLNHDLLVKGNLKVLGDTEIEGLTVNGDAEFKGQLKPFH